MVSLQWRHNEQDGVSNHQPYDCLLNCLFRPRSKKISKLNITGLCAGNSPVTGEFPAWRTSNAENVSIWWHHHVPMITVKIIFTRFQLWGHNSMWNESLRPDTKLWLVIHFRPASILSNLDLSQNSVEYIFIYYLCVINDLHWVAWVLVYKQWTHWMWYMMS